MSADWLGDPDEVGRRIRAAVNVTPQLVVIAKSFVAEHCTGDARSQLDALVDHLGARVVEPVLVHPSADVVASVAHVARFLSARVAFGEAIWSLIGGGVLIPRMDRLWEPQASVAWTTVVPGSGGSSSGWSFPEFGIPVPERFWLALSRRASDHYLTDGDLFLTTLNVPDLHPLIEEALREAVRCFRQDLYLPCLAMLAKAAEGFWTLLGEALIEVAGTNRSADRLRAELAKDEVHFARLVADVTELYSRQDIYGAIAKSSEVSLDGVRRAREWTDLVRGSRNVLHYRATTPVPNTYEKTAALLLGAVPTFQSLAAVTAAARSFSFTAAAEAE